VAEHALMKKDDAMRSIVRLLDDVSGSPDRYTMIGRILFVEMATWTKDEKDLSNIRRLMDNSERRLSQSRGGKTTQDIQMKIVFRLDELASTRLASSPVLLAVLPGTRVDGIFLADASDRLALVDPRGIRLATAAGPGSGQGQVSLGVADGASPNAVLITPANRLYLADTGNHRVQVFDDGLQFLYWLGAGTNGFSFGPCCAASTEPGGFTRPRSIAYDDGATLFVGDEVGGGRVQRFDLAGTWLSTLELGFVPTAMIVDQQGALWIADEAGNAVHRFLP
jgi:hypothetical protein